MERADGRTIREREERSETVAQGTRKLSLDTWAVLAALLAAVLIRLGVIPRVGW